MISRYILNIIGSYDKIVAVFFIKFWDKYIFKLLDTNNKGDVKWDLDLKI